MSVGKMREFDVESGSWVSYCERLEMYFAANDVSEEKKLATLISVVGDRCYELMSDLASPKKPSELKYSELVALVQKHLNPKPSIMAERYRFRLRRQAAGETIARYVAELKKLARTCEFGITLEDNLRDQFVCGVSGDIIRQRLFAEEDLTYAKAVALACSLEAAEHNAAVIAGDNRVHRESAAEVHRVASGGGDAGRGAARRLQAQRGETVLGTREAPGNTGVPAPGTACAACGATNHVVATCRFREYVCSLCKATGHLRRVCPSWSSGSRRSGRGRGGGRPRAHYFTGEASGEDASESDEEEALYRMALSQYKPVSVTVCINGQQLVMEVDTGAASSFISKKTYELYFANEVIQKTNTTFKFYDGTKIKPYGVITPLVSYNAVTKRLDLYIVEQGETSLMGRQWLAELSIKIPVLKRSPAVDRINSIGSVDSDLNIILDRYKEVFDGTLGCYNGGTAQLRVREGATPVFRRARPLPFALRARVDAELDAMLESGIIEPVDCADWATPLVPVMKKDGGLRVCADFKVTLNPVLMVDRYPLPKVEELFANLSGGEMFTKIDLSQAYNQICLSEDSKMLTVINTHRGLFKYNRLVFGLSSSSGIFCRISESIVKDVPNAQTFCDDILIFGKTRAAHLATLEAVLSKLKDLGLKVKKSNVCGVKFGQSSI